MIIDCKYTLFFKRVLTSNLQREKFIVKLFNVKVLIR